MVSFYDNLFKLCLLALSSLIAFIKELHLTIMKSLVSDIKELNSSKQKGSRSRLPFMDLAGIEPASENLFIRGSPITVIPLHSPHIPPNDRLHMQVAS